MNRKCSPGQLWKLLLSTLYISAFTFGCILPSIIIVSVLAWVYYKYQNVGTLQSILASLRPAVVALIAGAGVSILKTAVFSGQPLALSNVNWLAVVSFGAAFFVLRKFKWNPILVMAICGVVGLVTVL